MSSEVYDPAEIEGKWRRRWDDNEVHRVRDDDPRPKYYCLDMFPYPSGSGLHVGHWRGYVLSDVWTRYKTLQGYSVLHPMGWDAFGLPAENDAIKKGIHPRLGTDENIRTFRRQLDDIGAMYDWSREIDTTDPAYYRWTQWIFLQMHRRGLAYKASMPINWCPSCKCGLANEEVVDGACERCGTLVSEKEMSQWMLRITHYAERLLRDLDKLDWPEKVKTMQANWIGRSEGATIRFTAVSGQDGSEHDLNVFTTRPDTLFGATYMVLAPEHPLVQTLCAPDRADDVRRYVAWSRQQSDVERTNVKQEKTGVDTGAVAVNPVNGARIPSGSPITSSWGTAPAPSWRCRHTTTGTSSLPPSSACRLSRSSVTRTAPRTPTAGCPRPTSGPATWSTPGHSTACRGRKASAVWWTGWPSAVRARARSTTACATGYSPASATGASRSPSSTAAPAARFGCPKTTCRCCCPTWSATSRPARANPPWPPSPNGSRWPAPTAGGRRCARPTRCRSGRAPAGTSCATPRRPAIRRWSTPARCATGYPWTSTSAASSTPSCTCCTPASSSSSCTTSRRCRSTSRSRACSTRG